MFSLFVDFTNKIRETKQPVKTVALRNEVRKKSLTHLVKYVFNTGSLEFKVPLLKTVTLSLFSNKLSTGYVPLVSRYTQNVREHLLPPANKNRREKKEACLLVIHDQLVSQVQAAKGKRG